jgi:hypothetical protein
MMKGGCSDGHVSVPVVFEERLEGWLEELG